MSFEKVFKADNSAGLSKREFELACKRADNNFAQLTRRTIKVIIGAPGVAGCDANFASAANTTKQNLDLGTLVPASLIPARARIRDIFVVTETTFAGTSITNFGVEAGNASAGAQHFASTDLIAAGAIGQVAVGAGYTPLAITNAAQSVWISGTPTGGNWSALTAGKMSVYIVINDVSGL